MPYAESMLLPSCGRVKMPTKEEYIKVIQAFKFYRVESEGQLVLALLEHVERLQANLPPIKDTQPQKVRGG